MNPLLILAALVLFLLARRGMGGAPGGGGGGGGTGPGGGGGGTGPGTGGGGGSSGGDGGTVGGPVVSASYNAPFANGWWPRVTAYADKIAVACGTFGESWVVELSLALQPLREQLIIGNAPGGLWRRADDLLIWYGAGGDPPFEILELNARENPWNAVAVARTPGGTELDARDGHYCEWLPGQPNRIDGAAVTYPGPVDGVAIANYGPAQLGDRGWFAHSVNDNSLIVRSKIGGTPRLKTAGVPILGIRVGPNGETAVSGGGRVWGWNADGTEIDLTVSPWGNEACQYLWTGRDGQTWALSSVWHASGSTMLMMRPWGSRDAIVIPNGADFATACEIPGATVIASSNAGRMTARTVRHSVPLNAVAEPGVQPTLPVSASFNSPRWFGMFFERNDSRYKTDPGHGTCVVLTGVPSVSPTPGATTWGYPFYAAHGGTAKVIAAFDATGATNAVDTTPADKLIAVYWGLEGGPGHWNEQQEQGLMVAREKAAQRGVPLCVYMDGGYWSDDADNWANAFLRPEDIPLHMCYPHRHFGPSDAFSWEGLDGAQDVARWREGLRRRNGKHTHMGIVRTMYTQTWNYPPAFIESLQPAITQLGNDFSVWCDLGFSWARPSGILQPWGTAPSIRPVLEPWAIALTNASIASGRS